MSRDLLLEIGTEEIPAGYLENALANLATRTKDALVRARLPFAGVRSMGTPRRLVLVVSGLGDRQEDLEEEVVGPPATIAYDKEGKATKAALGFAKRNGIDLAELRTGPVTGKSGEYLICTRRETGRQSEDVLVPLLSDVLLDLGWPKSMRWSEGRHSFVRPVHWIVCLLGSMVLPLTFAGVRAGRRTRGHRFLAPGEIDLNGDIAAYEAALRDAFVIPQPAVRRTMIAAELRRIEGETRARVREDEALIEEVANLVEYPVGICGEFPEEYLQVPPQVVVSAMRSHQRYFAMEDQNGSLLNRFVSIAGTITRDMAVVRAGNERVLAARLADAQFFYQEDRKATLDEFAAKLAAVVFQDRLGTVADKVERICNGAVELAQNVGVAVDKTARGAKLCKADLTCLMVGEFPDLQGVMGRRYAELANEDPDVAIALEQHYQPRGAHDAVPSSELASVIGIADRLDTIVGCFAVGLAPTGSADPYGLRRAALGVLRILLERTWTVDLKRLVQTARDQLAGKVDVSDEVVSNVMEFLRGRFRGLLTDAFSLSADCVDAALVVGFRDPRDARARAVAVSSLRTREDFEPLASAFKRIANILKGQSTGTQPRPELFTEGKEGELWSAYEEVRGKVDGCLAEHNYADAMGILVELKAPVDAFFETVLVMDDDEKIRSNRLALLSCINDTFSQIADFRQLVV